MLINCHNHFLQIIIISVIIKNDYWKSLASPMQIGCMQWKQWNINQQSSEDLQCAMYNSQGSIEWKDCAWHQARASSPTIQVGQIYKVDMIIDRNVAGKALTSLTLIMLCMLWWGYHRGGSSACLQGRLLLLMRVHGKEKFCPPWIIHQLLHCSLFAGTGRLFSLRCGCKKF